MSDLTKQQLRQLRRDQLKAQERRKAVTRRRYKRQYARRHNGAQEI